jgi:hypothetical protein
MKWLLIIVGALLAGQISAQGSSTEKFTITNFPLFGAAITPSDATVLDPPRAIRADANGAVTARCAGQGRTGTAITLTLVAGEFFPCQVVMVLDTGTDAITIHGFY